LAAAAAAILQITRSGQKPNFYEAPLTANEQWSTDAKKSLFDYSGAYTDQFLRGLSGMNPDLNNPAFMGGIKVPSIDWTKMPARPSSGAAGTGATSKPPGLTSDGSGPTGVPGDPFGHITSPAGSAGDPFGGLPDQQDTAKNYTWDDIKAWGPQAVKLAQVLLGQGLPLATIISFVASKFGKQQTLPRGKDFSGVDLTPAGVTHRPPRTPYDPGFASGAAGQFNRGQENRLANDPGQFAPERLGGGQGFGYGLGYEDFYKGGGGKYKP
jgi:hypothetical protein